jgi:hypothetical protein
LQDTARSLLDVMVRLIASTQTNVLALHASQVTGDGRGTFAKAS